MAVKFGFFNALRSQDGTYDRKYSAEDYSDNLGAIVSDGVRRSGDNDLAVTPAGGLALRIAPGWAWVKGRYMHNDSELTGMSVPTPPVGDLSRIDRIVIRMDNTPYVRGVGPVYREGAPSANPQPPRLEREGNVYEIALADILVRPGATEIKASDITDRRGDNKTLQDGVPIGGWITTPVGYDDYFTALDEQFTGWFSEVKDTLASVTMVREYTERITPQAETSTAEITIPQYDPTGVDVVRVAANGLQLLEGEDYTLSGRVITFTTPKKAGTDIDVTIGKSVDGTGLGSVADKVDELEAELSTMKNIGEYIYFCNGATDNVALSDIARAFLASAPENAQLLISVYGTFGATAPDSGDGTSTSRARWMNLGSATASETRRLVFDFANCSPVTLTGEAGKHYIAVYGAGATIRNMTLVARQRNAEGTFVGFVAPGGAGVLCESCRFDFSAYTGSYVAGAGTFRDCSGVVVNSRADSFAFAVEAGALLRVFGGTYKAYTQLSGSKSAVFGENGANGAVFASGVNCPTEARSGYYQTHGAYLAQATTKGLLSGLVTGLTAYVTGSGVVVRDTIPGSFGGPSY